MSQLTPQRDISLGKIRSHLRGQWLVETPEELVRQEFVCHLVNHYGYDLAQMAEEMHLPLGRGSVRADIVVWRSVQDKADGNPPLIIAECKSNNVTITPRDYGQGESYARNVGAPFFVTHNQRDTKVWRVLKDKVPGYVELITDLPMADASDKEIEELIKKLKVFKEDEFADLLHQCHNVIRNRDKLDPAAAFDEIAKILFVKVYVEREMRAKRKAKNLFSLAVLDEQFGTDPLNDLFARMRAGYRDDKLFAGGAKIGLKVGTGREIVRLLERYNLSDTSEDVKGIAFERFLGKTFRGEIGQFFTPREVVRFMVEMLDPKPGDIICDPASGSGGFLIRVFAKVREQLTAEADAEYERTRSGVEKKKLSPAKKAGLLRAADDLRRRTLDPKNTASPIYRLSNHGIYGTDANDRMARTSKMNMIMHGDGHGGVHHWDGFLNINGIFEGRFDIILTNPPFGANVDPEDRVIIPDADEWDSLKRKYNQEFGTPYREAVARVEKAATEKARIASLFELPKRGVAEKAEGKLGKIKTELLFIERCLDLLCDGAGKKPAGRLGIVLPEGVFNNPSLQWVRDFVEDRAWLRAIISLPQETFVSSGTSQKCSVLFLHKFTTKERADYDGTKAKARAEIDAQYAPEMETEFVRFTAEIAAAKAARDPDLRKTLDRQFSEYRRAMEEKIASESRALLKRRWDYPIFLYEAEHVGITATGDADANELYPNDRQPPGGKKTCLDLYREFLTAGVPFLVAEPAADRPKPSRLSLMKLTPRRGAFALKWRQLERWDTFFYRADFMSLDWDLDRVPTRTLGELLKFESRSWTDADFPAGEFRYVEISAVTREAGIKAAVLTKAADAPSRATTLLRTGDIILATTRPYLGAFAVVPPEFDGCVCSSGFALATGLVCDELERDYLLLFLKSSAGLRQMERRMTGGLYPAIVQDELEKIRVPMIGKSEQVRIVKHYTTEKARIKGRLEEAIRRARSETEAIEEQLLSVT